jgi:hypothetical protein
LKWFSSQPQTVHVNNKKISRTHRSKFEKSFTKRGKPKAEETLIKLSHLFHRQRESSSKELPRKFPFQQTLSRVKNKSCAVMKSKTGWKICYDTKVFHLLRFSQLFHAFVSATVGKLFFYSWRGRNFIGGFIQILCCEESWFDVGKCLA